MAEEKWLEHPDPEFYKFQEPGQTLIGTLIATGSTEIQGVDVNTYTVRTEGGLVRFLGGASLDNTMTDIPMNTKIKLSYVGKVRTGSGREVKKFQLWTA